MNYQLLANTISVLLCTSLLSPSIALAHSGGTDSSGCHRQSSTGTRHCHNSGSNSSSNVSDSTIYIVGGSILAIAIGYFLIKETSNRNSQEAKIKPKKNVPHRIDLNLSSTISNSNPVDGELITLNLFLKNEYETTASKVEISALLPSELKFVSAFTKRGKYNSATGIWNVGKIEPNSISKLIITAKVKSSELANFKSEIINANEIDLDSIPNNDNPKEDDITAISINDYSIDALKLKHFISVHKNYTNNSNVLKSDINNLTLVQKIALNKLQKNEPYKREISVKSLELLKNNYHIELEYKF